MGATLIQGYMYYCRCRDPLSTQIAVSATYCPVAIVSSFGSQLVPQVALML